MNKKQLITLWIVGIWCAVSIVLAIAKTFNKEIILTFIIMFAPVLIIGTLFFITFKKGLIKEEVRDTSKIIYKTRSRVIWGLLSIGFLTGGILGILVTETQYNKDIGALSERIIRQKSIIDEQRDTIEKAMKSTNGSGQSLYNLIARQKETGEWEQAKILGLRLERHQAEIQQADREIIRISVSFKSFFDEVQVGDIIWLHRDYAKLKTKGENVYAYQE